MLIHLLGPLQVHQGRTESFTPRERSVLAALALEPNRPVSTAKLARWLWEEEEYPARPQSTIQIYVCRLRRALCSQELRIVTIPGAYLLETSAGNIDAGRLEAVSAESAALARADSQGL